MPDSNHISFPVLKTSRLVLRDLNENDCKQVFFMRSDEEVNRFLDRPRVHNMEEALQFIKNVPVWTEKSQVYYWAIALKENNLLIGTICLFNLDEQPKRAEIGYELHPSYQGKGLMQEALEAVTRYGFDVLDLQIITACLVPENTASVKLLRRNHFVLDLHFQYTSKETAKDLYCYYLERAYQSPLKANTK